MCVHECARVLEYSCGCVSVSVCVQVGVCLLVHIRVYVCASVYVGVCLYVCVCVCLCVFPPAAGIHEEARAVGSGHPLRLQA